MMVRVAALDDVEVLDAMFARSYPVLLAADYPAAVLAAALPLIAHAQPDLVGSGRYFVVEGEGGAVLAAGGFSVGAPGVGEVVPGLGHVRHVVTDAQHTRRGYARLLLDRIVAEAAGAGCTRLACLSTLTAVPFYAALGFRALGPVDVPLAPGVTFPAIRMECALSQ